MYYIAEAAILEICKLKKMPPPLINVITHKWNLEVLRIPKNVKTSQAYFLKGSSHFFEDFSLTTGVSNH